MDEASGRVIRAQRSDYATTLGRRQVLWRFGFGWWHWPT